MCEEVIENETQELVPTNDTTIMESTNQELGVSTVDIEKAVADWNAYQILCDKLLDDTDYQKYGTGDKSKKSKKKSAWRKLARAFNISTEPISEDIQVDENGHIISAEYKVKASTTDGRFSVGIGVCSIYDKITYKDKGEVSNETLRLRFSNAEHDVKATAYTRAANRAISDHIGCGEVSAEELSSNHNTSSRAKLVKKTKKTLKKPTKTSSDKVIDTTAKTVTPKEDEKSDITTDDFTLNDDQLKTISRNGHIAKRLKDKENITKKQVQLLIDDLYTDKKIPKKIKDELTTTLNNFTEQ